MRYTAINKEDKTINIATGGFFLYSQLDKELESPKIVWLKLIINKI